MEKKKFSDIAHSLHLWESTNKTSHELDAEMFETTEYEGMKFRIIFGSWTDLPEHYSSPLFLFENGDLVIFDKWGTMKTIKSDDYETED